MEKFDNTELLEPSELYKLRLKDAFHDNAVKFYEDMDKKANIDIDANQKACKEYYKLQDEINGLNKQKGGAKAGKILCIIFSILLIVAGVIFILVKDSAFESNPTIGIVVGALALVIGVGLIPVAVILSKKVKSLAAQIAEKSQKSDAALSTAYDTMKPLNEMYEWNMAADLMTNTTPLLQLDQVFDGKKYEMLHDKFGYDEDNSTNRSMVFVQSGAILGNPFIFEKTYNQNMINYRYTGTLVITYTETYADSDGRMRTRTVNQTLTAHLDKPKPNYYFNTTLVYGNDAAPKLCFSRDPTNINSMNDKQREKYVKEFDKKLDKLVSKSVDNGGSFTRLANEEFEAFFNALDRNNETEFRLLFTPLAQKNMLNLLKDTENGFGDDFSFTKKERLNYIMSGHMQGSDSLDRSPESLMCFDYKLAKDTFVKYCDKYLKDIFFSLAPLISIPLYQQHKTIDYIYKGTFKHNVTQAETESAANSHDVKLFMHPKTRSDGVILKSKFSNAVDKADLVTINAHSFSGEDRVTYVPVMGGDHKLHDVPVHWIEYFPICRETPFVVTDTEASLSGYKTLYESGKFNDIINKFSGSSDMLYKKRLFSFVLKDNK